MTKKSDINLRWTGSRLLAAVALGVMLLAIAAPRTAMAQGPCQPQTVRFLEEAAFGPSPELCAYVESLDPDLNTAFGMWLDAQFNLPLPNYPDLFSRAEDGGFGCPGAPVGQPGYCPDNNPSGCGGGTNCNRWNYTMWLLQNWFYQRALNTDPSEDQLRQRVAFALNQILVISGQHDNLRIAQRMLPYLQVLDKRAFGNFRDLLYDITLNPGMGRYLDMVGNNRSNPNENYAREILQLFSIGLSKINEDGTPILDDQGNIQPTYTQDTVANFAKVFTGWKFADQPRSGITNYFVPMVVNASAHDTGVKPLLDTCTDLPAGQDAPTDLGGTQMYNNGALDCIFNSPYVAPYISKNLIEHLVTSNPSPGYVSDIVQVFKDNGLGVRGDLHAVVKAILMHPEARSDGPGDPKFGHLREPVLWIANLLRAFDTGAVTTDFVLGEQFLSSDIRMDEDVFRSPTVFNFFPPDFEIPLEPGVLGPEFNIQSTSTALARINFACEVAFHGDAPFPSGCKMSTNADRPLGTWIDPAQLASLPTDTGALVDYLNNIMLHGQMTDSMRSTLIDDLNLPVYSDPVSRAREAVYLIATSSQYLVER